MEYQNETIINIECTLQYIVNKDIFEIKEIEPNLKKFILNELGDSWYILANKGKINKINVID